MSGGWVALTAVAVLVAIAVGFVLGRLASHATNASQEPPVTTGGLAESGLPPRVSRPDEQTDDRQERPAGLGSDAIADILDRFPIGVVAADADGEIVFRNAAVRSYDGTHVAALLDAAVDRQLAEALANGSASTNDSGEPAGLVEFYGPPRRVMSVSAERLANGLGVAFIDDVTESDRLDRVRTDFVANVSHELKTPIGALTLLAEALTDETDEKVRERLIGRMEVEAERAGKTIDHLVELSEIESNPHRELTAVGVADLIEASVDRVLEMARHRSVTIEVRADSEVADWAVLGHRLQLESALGNLVENAVAYSPPSSSVTVGATVASPGGANAGPRVKIAVIDHGVGIPNNQQDRIFERFYRVDRARSRETGGTGLGLSIVKRAAIAHRGSVSVTSVEGEGSTFVLELPISPHPGRQKGSR